MPELPKVSQDFVADATEYLAALDEMIAKNEELLGSIDQVKEAIDTLNGKTIDINLNVEEVAQQCVEIDEMISAIPDRKNVVINVETEGDDTGKLGNLDQRLLDSYVAKIAEVEAAERALNEQLLDSYVAKIAEVEAAERALNERMLDSYVAKVAEVEAAEKALNEHMLDSYIEKVAEVEAEQAALNEHMLESYVEAVAKAEAEVAAEIEAASAASEAAYRRGIGAVNDWAAQTGNAYRTVGQATEEMARNDDLLGAATDRLASQAAQAHYAFDYTINDLKVMQGLLYGLADSEDSATGRFAAMGAAIAGLVGQWAALKNAFAGNLWTGGPLAGQLNGILGPLKSWHLIADGILEATIAITSALIALIPAVAAVAPAFQDIYTHLTAVHQVSVALGQTIPPLSGWFEKMQHAMAPTAIELYGAALNTLNGEMSRSGSALNQDIAIVGHSFENVAVKIQGWLAQQGNMNRVLASGRSFLGQFASALGNVVNATSNLLRASPGTAHALLAIIDAATGLFNLFSSCRRRS